MNLRHGGYDRPMDVARKTGLEFRDLGRIGYATAHQIQRDIHAKVLAGDAPPTVLMLEHEPVITLTRRDEAAAHLLSAPQLLRREGIEVVETDRGGDITYHGPGQLVAYPIVPLNALRLNVRQYVAALEDAIVEALADFCVQGQRDPAGVGIWVEAQGASAKIAAIGVRVRRWVTLHGLALNVTTNLEHFRHIVPCGLPRPVTSLRQLLGDGCPSMDHVKAALSRALERRFLGG